MDDAPFMIPFIQVGKNILSIRDITAALFNEKETTLRVYLRGDTEAILFKGDALVNSFYDRIAEATEDGILVLFKKKPE